MMKQVRAAAGRVVRQPVCQSGIPLSTVVRQMQGVAGRADFTCPAGMLGFRQLNQNPPFPTPEELQTKLSEFMKSNFGDKVSFASFAQPERAEESDDEKPVPQSGDHFVFDFLPRDIKAHLDRFVIK